MSSIKKLVGIVLLAAVCVSCNSIELNEWSEFVPDETPFIIVPDRDATLTSAMNSKYLPLLDDVSSSSIALINKIDSSAVNKIQLKSILLYPGVDQKLQPIWIAEASSDFMEQMEETYRQKYGQQYYFFNQIPILKIRTNDQIFFAAKINEILLLSESSLGIENAIRVYRGKQPGAKLASTPIKFGSLIMNTPALETWLTQQSKVSYYANIQDAFSGTKPVRLSVVPKDTTKGGGIELSGNIPVFNEPKSTLVNAFSSKNTSFVLDQYISFDAAAFALLRLPPVDEFPESLVDTTRVDSFFINNKQTYQQIAGTFGNEFAIEFFAKSGFRSANEHAFIRKLKQPDRVSSLFKNLSNNGLIKKVENSYFVRSASLCRLVGSSLCGFSNFYIQIVDGALIMAPRRGLVEMIASDYKRRQTIIYESFYKKIKKNLPKKISGLAIGGKKLFTFLKPYLKNSSYISALTSKFDYISMAAVNKGANIQFTLSTYNIKSEEKPFIENWVLPVNTSLTGPPIFADIQGSANKEVIFATKSGKVYVIAAGGGVVQTYSTDGDTPIGSPVAYDWYNTGEKVVMVAAGNKVYAWGTNGDLLPKFPFSLNERVTTPLMVTDFNDNGQADVIVATANRKIHVLNARSNHLVGWPVEANAVLNSKPLVTQFRSRKVLAAFASNAVHAWGTAGRALPGFPHFIGASFTGSPVSLNGEIVGAAADGTLYAFGEGDLFDNSLQTTGKQFSGGGQIEMLTASQSALLGTPLVSQESKLAAMNTDGSFYLFNTDGSLILSESMGQSPAQNWIPVVTDVNGDKSEDIVTLADYGRLYAWDIESGERIHQLPTAAMKNANIGDIDGDGLAEVVAQTKEGVISWTIN